MNKEKVNDLLDSKKLNIKKDDDKPDLNCTYSFTEEDHTLGNILRYILMKDPEVNFCGYSVPHPSEDIMNVRIQTKEVKTDKILNKALTRISKITDIINNKFNEALSKYDSKNN